MHHRASTLLLVNVLTLLITSSAAAKRNVNKLQKEADKERRLRRKRKPLDVTPFFLEQDYAGVARKLDSSMTKDKTSESLRHAKKKLLTDVTPFMTEQESTLLNVDEEFKRELQAVMSMDPAPTLSPAEPDSCSPTTGTCVSTFSELQSIASNAEINDVIALCGGTITTEEAILIEQSGTTLCCSDDATEDCVMTSRGVDRNLVVAGDSFTLKDVKFFNRQSPVGVSSLPIDGNAGGGNVVIDGEGVHTIQNCEFHNGAVEEFGYGGNLFVKTPSSVFIKNTIFANGTASFGAGVAVWGAVEFVCNECEFLDNNFGSGAFSGNLETEDRNPGQAIVYENSRFIGNEGEYGGGFLASGIGSMPKLSVLDCVFEGNTAGLDGGAGTVFPDTDIIDLRLTDNSGENNEAIGGDCEDFAVFLSTGEAECYSLTEDFP